MPIRVPQETVFVMRDGKTVKPEIGKPFNFTSDELEDLKRMRPQAIRVPVNEGAADDEDKGTGKGTGGGENEDDVDLSKLTKAQLLELAKERGVTVDDNATKAAIIEALSGDDL